MNRRNFLSRAVGLGLGLVALSPFGHLRRRLKANMPGDQEVLVKDLKCPETELMCFRIEEHKAAILAGVSQPITVDCHGRILDGRHRWAALRELGITRTKVLVI